MKNIFIFITCLILNAGLQAQIPNSNFETVSFEITGTDVDQWGVQGAQEQLNLGGGNYAVKVTNTDKSALLISDINSTDPDKMAYYAIMARPDSLKLRLQFDLKGTDTLFVITRNEELNAPFGEAVRKYTGTRSTWSPITAKINYTSPGFADSAMVAVYIKSADPSANKSWFAVDAMQFVNISGNEVSTIPNKTFNNWQGDTVAYPQFWTTTALVKRKKDMVKDQDNSRISSTAASGVNALALETNATNGAAIGSAYSMPYDSFNSNINLTNPQPGFGISQRYSFLKGKYQFTQVGGDSSIIQVVMFNNGQVVSSDQVIFNQSTTMQGYEDFTIPIYYPGFSGTPDACLITMHSSHPDILSPTNGTTLWVDALTFNKDVNSIENVNSVKLHISPNPSTNWVTINTQSNLIQNVTVMDAQGKLVFEKSINASSVKMNLSHLQAGTYILNAYSNGSIATKRIQILK
jgi:hypothetical protein